MKLNNIVTFGCSCEVDHHIRPPSNDGLPAKPSETFGLVPLRSCAGRDRDRCLSECDKSQAGGQVNTCIGVGSLLRRGLHNMHARARKQPHPISWCLRPPKHRARFAFLHHDLRGASVSLLDNGNICCPSL
jgi:hypothetical protein